MIVLTRICKKCLVEPGKHVTVLGPDDEKCGKCGASGSDLVAAHVLRNPWLRTGNAVTGLPKPYGDTPVYPDGLVILEIGRDDAILSGKADAIVAMLEKESWENLTAYEPLAPKKSPVEDKPDLPFAGSYLHPQHDGVLKKSKATCKIGFRTADGVIEIDCVENVIKTEDREIRELLLKEGWIPLHEETIRKEEKNGDKKANRKKPAEEPPDVTEGG